MRFIDGDSKLFVFQKKNASTNINGYQHRIDAAIDLMFEEYSDSGHNLLELDKFVHLISEAASREKRSLSNEWK